MKKILSKLEVPYSGSSLARIAVECWSVGVLEEEDIRLLVRSGSLDWSKTAEDEDPAILWALKNEKFGIVDFLMTDNKINLQGDPSADLTSTVTQRHLEFTEVYSKYYIYIIN